MDIEYIDIISEEPLHEIRRPKTPEPVEIIVQQPKPKPVEQPLHSYIVHHDPIVKEFRHEPIEYEGNCRMSEYVEINSPPKYKSAVHQQTKPTIIRANRHEHVEHKVVREPVVSRVHEERKESRVVRGDPKITYNTTYGEPSYLRDEVNRTELSNVRRQGEPVLVEKKTWSPGKEPRVEKFEHEDWSRYSQAHFNGHQGGGNSHVQRQGHVRQGSSSGQGNNRLNIF